MTTYRMVLNKFGIQSMEEIDVKRLEAIARIVFAGSSGTPLVDYSINTRYATFEYLHGEGLKQHKYTNTLEALAFLEGVMVMLKLA